MFGKKQRQCGVYRIVNVLNEREYIGSTSRSFDERWREHIKALNAGQHTNTGLQEDWRTYGPDAFRFEIFEATERNAYRVIEREHYWLQQRDGHASLYNARSTGQVPPPRPSEPPKKRRTSSKDQMQIPYIMEARLFREVIPFLTWMSLVRRDCAGDGVFEYLPDRDIVTFMRRHLHEADMTPADAYRHIATTRARAIGRTDLEGQAEIWSVKEVVQLLALV